LKLKTVALSLNKDEIWEMKHFAEDELGVAFRFDAMISCRIDCSQDPLAFRLSPQEIIELDVEDPKRVTAWREFAEQFNGPVHSPGNSAGLYDCGGGIRAFAVDPSGKLRICGFSVEDAFDLTAGPFQEGWDKALLEVRQQKANRSNKCFACGIKAMCGMCPANGVLENRDPEMPVDFLCQVAHLRAYTLGLPIGNHGDCAYCPGGERHDEMMRQARAIELKNKLGMVETWCPTMHDPELDDRAVSGK
jgi:radical SAM protein with 4Fe4S-binding SPASM domain